MAKCHTHSHAYFLKCWPLLFCCMILENTQLGLHTPQPASPPPPTASKNIHKHMNRSDFPFFAGEFQWWPPSTPRMLLQTYHASFNWIEISVVSAPGIAALSPGQLTGLPASKETKAPTGFPLHVHHPTHFCTLILCLMVHADG